jgi:hypothetical protein
MSINQPYAQKYRLSRNNINAFLLKNNYDLTLDKKLVSLFTLYI